MDTFVRFSLWQEKQQLYVECHNGEDVERPVLDYLTGCEPYCHCSVRVSIENAVATKDLNMGFGYHYKDIVASGHLLYTSRFMSITGILSMYKK